MLRKTLGALALLMGLCAVPAMAQQQVTTLPAPRTAGNVSSTIAVTNTFQSVFAQASGRNDCAIQNNGTNTMWVFFGAIASATKATSFQLPAGATLNCGHNGTISTDQVSITGTSGDAFVATPNGGPVLAGAGSGGGGGGGAISAAAGSYSAGAFSAGAGSDGWDLTEGAKADTAYADPTGAASGSVDALLKGLYVQAASTTPVATTSTQLPAALGTTTPANSLAVTETDTGAGTGSVTSATTLFSVDMTGYESISVQMTSVGSGNTIIFETSDDNTTWYPTPGIMNSSGNWSTNTTNTQVTSLSLGEFPRHGRYFRARVSVYGSGTVSAAYTQSKQPVMLSNAINVNGGVNSGTSQSGIGGFPNMVLAQSANQTAVSTTQFIRNTGTLVGAQVVRPYSLPAAEWQTTNITLTASNQALVAAGGSGFYNYLTSYTISCGSTWTANTIEFEQGTTAIWDVQMPAGASVVNSPAFHDPLHSASNAAINVKATGAVTGTCIIAADGYTAADQ